MPEIFLDGEPVRIEGPVPSSLQDLVTLIEQSLASSGRVLAGVTLDGRGAESEADGSAYAAARRIDFASLSVAEAVARIAHGCAQKAVEARLTAVDLSHAVLREPWPEVAPKLAALGGRLGELMQDLGSLGGVPEYGALAGELASDLGRWMDAIAAGDAGGVCLCFDTSIVPLLERVAVVAATAPESF